MNEIEIWKLLLRKARIYQITKQYGICSWLYLLWKQKLIDDGEYDMMRQRLMMYLKSIENRSIQIGWHWYYGDLKSRLVFIAKVIKNIQDVIH